ncbi:DUF4147 domain-containing protein [Gammaproteobacteria bacterium]|nr:DUF4147 domain-containing protein [Gammaproteobacteria bacterium]
MIADRDVDPVRAFWSAAIDAVGGEASVRAALADDPPFVPDRIIAVGKAAVGMCRGALAVFPEVSALVVTKYDHADSDFCALPNVDVIEAGHPVPDSQSLRAGDALLDAVAAMSPDSKLLLLVSGGASALAESLPDTIALDDLQALTQRMLASGATIAEINAERKRLSRIKDGRLLQAFIGAEARVYAISDVEGDAIGTIGSGIGDPRYCTKATRRLVATNAIARQAAAEAAEAAGLAVRCNQETLYGDVYAVAQRIAAMLRGAEAGVYLFGGEPTIMLPLSPGRGGRNQALALALAVELQGVDGVRLLVAGSDGSDGPTDAAGGWISGESVSGDGASARSALAAANAGAWLEQHGCLFVTGPTHTNVMDLLIAIVD